MFEFVDGNVYTSYAVNCGWEDNLCTDADFNALDAQIEFQVLIRTHLMETL